ncbi:MAG TPA: hypothetical protein VIN40_00395 [Candidatus Tyrphobacter sp.]
MRTTLFVSSMLLAALALSAAPARADLSLAAGGWAGTSPSQVGGALMLSTGASIPTVPVGLQATLLVPITRQGGYAITGEIRGLSGGGFGGAYVGIGAGVGNLSLGRDTGPVVTVFGGKGIAPHTAIEVRLYQGLQTGGTTAGFLGLRFTL